MATQKEIFLTGSIGNIIFYKRGGKYCGRTKPRKVRQAAITKTYSQKFGQASATARLIRMGLQPILTHSSNAAMRNRLNAVVYQWLLTEEANGNNSLQPATAITGFQFNENASIKARFKPGIQINWDEPGKLVITLPTFYPNPGIAAPVKTSSVDLLLAITCCSVTNSEPTASYHSTINIPYTKEMVPEWQLEWPFELQPQSLVVVAAAMQYKINKKEGASIMGKEEWLPADIIEVMYRKD
jgi:hypothetical protein